MAKESSKQKLILIVAWTLLTVFYQIFDDRAKNGVERHENYAVW